MNRKVSQQRLAEEIVSAGHPQDILPYLERMAPGVVERYCMYVRTIAHKFGISESDVDELFKRASENPS